MKTTEKQREQFRQYYQKNREKILQKRKPYYQENKERIKERTLNYNNLHRNYVLKLKAGYSVKAGQKLKKEIILHYGNGQIACSQCGFEDIRALTIDHINGGGSGERKRLKISNFYYWLRKNNYPDGYQVLCMNCQFIKRRTNRECRKGR